MKLKEVSKIAYKQWHFEKNKRLNLETISSASEEVVYWQCNKKVNHVWASHIYTRVQTDIECPICINSKMYKNGPELLAFERGFKSKRRNMNYVINTWHCKKCKKVWFTESSDTIPTGTYCSNCYDEEVVEICFAEEHPELAKEWATDNILSVTEVLSYYPLEVKWKCKICNNFWFAMIEERRFGIKSCPYCSKKLPYPGINSFLALYPDMAEEWVYELNEMVHPDVIFPDNHSMPLIWRCKKCHTLHVATVYDKVHGIKGCKNCNSENPISAERYMFLKSEFHSSNGNVTDFDLMLPDYTASLIWLCKECNETFIFSMKERYIDARDCACVEGKRVIPGKTSFKALHSDMLKEWNLGNWLFIDPDNIIENYSGTVWWTCSECRNSYAMSPKKKLYYQKRKKQPCPYCKGLRRKMHHFL